VVTNPKGRKRGARRWPKQGGTPGKKRRNGEGNEKDAEVYCAGKLVKGVRHACSVHE